MISRNILPPPKRRPEDYFPKLQCCFLLIALVLAFSAMTTHAWARYYDPSLGRFISPDSVIPDAYNPQALASYSYVVNNPLRYTDPSGHVFEDELKKWSDKYKRCYDKYQALFHACKKTAATEKKMKTLLLKMEHADKIMATYLENILQYEQGIINTAEKWNNTLTLNGLDSARYPFPGPYQRPIFNPDDYDYDYDDPGGIPVTNIPTTTTTTTATAEETRDNRVENAIYNLAGTQGIVGLMLRLAIIYESHKVFDK